jgi:outer membrane lipoprotein SlyB
MLSSNNFQMKIVDNVKNNPIGAIAGAILSYWVVNKYLGINGMFKKVAVVSLGAIVGVHAEKMIRAKMSTPTLKTIKK